MHHARKALAKHTAHTGNPPYFLYILVDDAIECLTYILANYQLPSVIAGPTIWTGIACRSEGVAAVIGSSVVKVNIPAPTACDAATRQWQSRRLF